jgi:hypothetical protein
MTSGHGVLRGILFTCLGLAGTAWIVGCSSDNGTATHSQDTPSKLGSTNATDGNEGITPSELEIPKAFEPKAITDDAEPSFTTAPMPFLDDIDLAGNLDGEEKPKVGLDGDKKELGIEERGKEIPSPSKDPMEEVFNRKYELPHLGIQGIDKEVMERLGFPPVLPILEIGN